jgi:hypothetical protein
MFSSYITEMALKTLQIIDNIFNNSNDKNYIIDPLTCIIRLAMLSYKEVGTKISIADNKISFNEPHLLQGTIRWSQGDNRDDLHNLYRPIIKALDWYDYNKPEIRNLFELAYKGLNILKLAYTDNSSITHSLELYSSNIKDKLDKKVVSQDSNNDNIVINKIYMDLKQLWNENEISIVNNIFEEIKKSDEIEIKSLMKALDSLIFIKEERVKNIILTHTTLL